MIKKLIERYRYWKGRPKIEIRFSEWGQGIGSYIKIGGKEITVTGFTIEAQAGQLPEITLRMLLRDLDLMMDSGVLRATETLLVDPEEIGKCICPHCGGEFWASSKDV